MYTGIIYCATSPSNKKYYGKTVRKLDTRIKQHFKRTVSDSCYFAIALKKYKEKIIWTIVETIELEDKIELRKKLSEREKYWIKKDKTNIHDFGYNMTDGGDGGAVFGHKISEETKQKLSKANKGQKRSIETCLLMSKNGKGKSRGKGKPKSDIHKLNISLSNLLYSKKGIKKSPFTDEHKKNMSLARKGKIPWNKGLTKENNEKIKNTGNKISLQLKGKSKQGHKLTEDQKEHLRQINLGKKQSKETIEKRKKTIELKKING